MGTARRARARTRERTGNLSAPFFGRNDARLEVIGFTRRVTVAGEAARGQTLRVRVGAYDVLEEIGRGALGTVYRARSSDGRDLAIKVLLKGDPDQRARFERERRVLSSFGAHDGFVPLLDSGEWPQGPFLVMPFVPGGTLRQRLDRGQLSVPEVAKIGATLARALGRAHERGIAHRDLRPENVLFDAEGRPLISDLGIARRVEEGTPAGDVLALGTLLRTCLAGRRDVPRWLSQAIERATAKRPSDRFQDGHEMARALAAGDVTASVGRRRVPLAAVAIGLGIGVAAVSALALVVGRESAPPPPKPDNHALALEHADRAIALMDSMVVAAAADEADAALALDPRCALAYTARGRARWERGDRKGAMEDHDRAIQLDPRCALAWIYHANGLTYFHERDRAIAEYTRAIELDPGRAASWNSRGNEWIGKPEYEKAIADYTKAIELAPGSAVYWANRGLARAKSSIQTGALEDCARAIALQPGYAVAWANQGYAKMRAGDYVGAIADCTKALELDPRCTEALSTRGLSRGVRDDFDGEIEDCTKALEISATYTPAWIYRGVAKTKKGDYEGALRDLDQAVAVGPNWSSAWLDRGKVRESLGEDAGAIQDYEHFLSMDPDDPDAADIRKRLEALRKR
jgi:tetratricopeptide (TPR) repeat protein/tRNA A-37 threonylcarbamoyl transferase component Bud32